MKLYGAWGRQLALPAAIHVRRNLDQAPIRIPAIDRAQRAAGALPGNRAFLDRDAMCLQMRHHLVRRGGGQEAQILAAGGLVVRGEPFHLVGIARPDVDLLVTELKGSPRRFAAAGVEHLDFHAQDLAIPLGGNSDLGDVDHEMIESFDLDRHALSFRRGAPHALSACGKLCYNRADDSFKISAFKNNTGRTLEMITRRNALGLLAATPLAASPLSKAFAADYPSRPVKFVVGYPPG